MLNKALDRLIAIYFGQTTSVAEGHNLDSLEQDVWRNIHISKIKQENTLCDRIAYSLQLPKLQLASLALALILGISMGAMFPIDNNSSNVESIVEMSIFTANTPLLPLI